ncbi:hypothetical protein LTR37_018077 [Vermiconidia calcicola]|uniref:Uncharacterized protein n=1 Tax=Vermiconidia calcicola TaxID=1690605 RepID=A0ACC3MJP4_9PEZI|nr:hypothetical protein LTR37_018077 [Vermiconidia calcicola]
MQTHSPPTDMEAIENALTNLRISTANNPTQAVALLAEASKQSIPAREQLAGPLILRTLTEIIETSINDSLETVDVALRCIGNACIDNSVAREAVTNIGFSWASLCLRDGSSSDIATRRLTAKVLYNICSDYEPAQQQCYREMLHHQLINLCARDSHQQPPDDIELLLELLFWICSQKDQVAQDLSTTTNDATSLPGHILDKLISLPHAYRSSLEPEDFALLLETCLIFFRDPSIQRDILVRNQLTPVWRILKENEVKISSLGEDSEDRKLLVPLSTSLIWCLSDIAASPGIPAETLADVHTAFIKVVVVVAIKAGANDRGNERLAIAGCQVLGNLLWSGKPVASDVVEDAALQHSVLALLNTSRDVELLHSAAGLLVQLSRSSVEVREDILQQDGIKLLRALGKDSVVNQQRFAELAREVVLSSSADGDTAMVEAPE